MRDLAQKFSQNSYYPEVYNRPDKFFWQDIEKTLANDGVTLTGLNQYADSYLREVLNEVRFIRNEGLELSLSLKLDYYNNYASFSGITEKFYTLLNGSLIYSHQLNLNSQLSFNMSLSE